MSIAYCREPRRITLQLRTLERLVERPRRLLELERAALADAILIRVRESTGVEEHGDDPRCARAA